MAQELRGGRGNPETPSRNRAGQHGGSGVGYPRIVHPGPERSKRPEASDPGGPAPEKDGWNAPLGNASGPVAGRRGPSAGSETAQPGLPGGDARDPVLEGELGPSDKPEGIASGRPVGGRGHGSLVMTARFGHSCEAGEPVGKHGATRAELGFGPAGNRLARKAGDHCQLDVQRMSAIVERDRRDKGDLVFRTPPRLAACEFSAQIGVVDLDLTDERVERFTLGHDLHEFVLHPPGGGIADPQGPLQRQ